MTHTIKKGFEHIETLKQALEEAMISHLDSFSAFVSSIPSETFTVIDKVCVKKTFQGSHVETVLEMLREYGNKAFGKIISCEYNNDCCHWHIGIEKYYFEEVDAPSNGWFHLNGDSFYKIFDNPTDYVATSLSFVVEDKKRLRVIFKKNGEPIFEKCFRAITDFLDGHPEADITFTKLWWA